MKNKGLSFFSKVAGICNICSLIMIITSRWFNALPVYDVIQRTIVILGFLSIFLNIVLQVIFLVMRITKKDIPVAAWLRIFNIAVFAIQILYYIILPGKTI